jgi:hypothetical protein
LLLDYPKERSLFPDRNGRSEEQQRNAIAFSKQTGDQLGSGVLAPSIQRPKTGKVIDPDYQP